MSLIVGVRFKNNGKTYYFDPGTLSLQAGDSVIVETARGQEWGRVSIANTQVDDKEVSSPLKPVVRRATKEDDERAEENERLGKEAVKITAQKVEKHKLNMKLVDAEYAFDRSKVTIFFTADGRVDFRELVRDIAGALHTRIELRQIYERDDIRLRGSLGPCGMPCCCITYLNEYEKVTVKMAKNQNLSLNPTKVSGMCGKLMCCLRYENDYYAETCKLMPKVGARVKTADGSVKVEGVDLLKRQIRASLENKDGGIEIKVYKLGQFELPGKTREREEEEDSDTGEE
ncbi:MAG TPA: stage 0 sporulation family protein [Firmicutes bacterium]|nr:stage 0 sporulation family protein [Bacillota bacterium]